MQSTLVGPKYGIVRGSCRLLETSSSLSQSESWKALWSQVPTITSFLPVDLRAHIGCTDGTFSCPSSTSVGKVFFPVCAIIIRYLITAQEYIQIPFENLPKLIASQLAWDWLCDVFCVFCVGCMPEWMAISLPEIRPIAAIRDDEENAKPYTVPVLLSKDHKKILKKKQVSSFPVFWWCLSYGDMFPHVAATETCLRL